MSGLASFFYLHLLPSTTVDCDHTPILGIRSSTVPIYPPKPIRILALSVPSYFDSSLNMEMVSELRYIRSSEQLGEEQAPNDAHINSQRG